MTRQEQMDSKTVKSPGCWKWIGGKNRHNGKGRVWDPDRRKHVSAPRAAWEINHGPIPEGMYVCHHCDNPNCVRPSHLFLGTPSDNMQDAIRKGRLWQPDTRGERHGGRVLTAAMVINMRRMHRGGLSCAKISRHLGIKLGTVYNAVSGRRWASIRDTAAMAKLREVQP
jgi:hypothetical protein